MIWKKPIDVEAIDRWHDNTMQRHIGIEFLEFGDDYIKAKMPVDNRTVQPERILHGGASVVLAESLGSLASVLCIDTEKYFVVGIEINANHIRSIKEGFVYATALPLHLGSSTHVWDIKIVDEQERLICVSRLTVYVLKRS